jgi:hypothetical protein
VDEKAKYAAQTNLAERLRIATALAAHAGSPPLE